MNLDRERGAPPLYLQVTDILRRRILEDTWEDGEALPPEHQLCQEFAIARGTLRQALDQLKQEGLVSREQGRGTFVTLPGVTAATEMPPSDQIAFIVPYVRDTFVATILLGVERGAEEQGFSVVFNHVSNNVEEQSVALRRCAEQSIAGVVLYPVNSTHVEPINQLRANGYPIVLVDRYLHGVSTDYVISDHFGGALQAMQHLIGLGHRRIAFVAWTDPATSIAHREVGYRQALAEAGIAYDPALTFEVEGYPHFEPDELDTLLTLDPPVTAVFAANDQIALAVNRAARQFGRRIPDDLALVGFDDLDVARQLEVPLTTVAQSPADLGYAAVELLVKRVRGEAPNIQRVILPTELIVRQSCGSRLSQP